MDEAAGRRRPPSRVRVYIKERKRGIDGGPPLSYMLGADIFFIF